MNYILSLGANTPGARATLERVIGRIAAEYHAVKASAVYTTPALNGVSPSYCNAVLKLESDLDAAELGARMKELERSEGRTPESKATGLVPLDIDVVMCDGAVLRPADYEREYFTRGLQML